MSIADTRNGDELNLAVLQQLRLTIAGFFIGARRAHLRFGKAVTQVRFARRLLGAPRAVRHLIQTNSTATDLDIVRIGPLTDREEIHLPTIGSQSNSEAISALRLQVVSANERFVYVIENGKYRNADGAHEVVILDGADQMIAELSPDVNGPNLHRIYGQFLIRPERVIGGRVVVLTSLGARGNYFHWLTELLTKVHLLHVANLWQPNHDTYLVNGDETSYVRESLRAVGLGSAAVINTVPGMRITADQLIVPSHSERHDVVPSWAISYLRSTFLVSTPTTTSSRKIYLDRSTSVRRRITNSQDVQRLVASRGYEIVDAATMSIFDQAALFSDAKIIVASHGAGLANLCFAAPGAALLEIFSPFWITSHFRVLAAQANVRYECLVGLPPPGIHSVRGGQGMSVGFTVPIDRLAQALDAVELRAPREIAG